MQKQLNRIHTLIITCLIPSLFWGQKSATYKLYLKGISATENRYISKIKHRTAFHSKTQLLRTKDSILEVLKETGYLTLTQDSVRIENNQYHIHLKLGKKIAIAKLHVAAMDFPFIKSVHPDLTCKNDTITLPFAHTKKTLNTIHEALVNQGEPFAKVRLGQIHITSNLLKAHIRIDRDKKRSISSITVKGYDKFPKSFLKHYYKSNRKQLISPEALKEISRKSKQLEFVQELKAPQLLFTKDSTIVYLFLTPKKNSSFDGLLNFVTENDKIQLRGTIDLQLNNAFHQGERLELNWASNNKKQELNLSASTPYIWNSKFTTSIKFNLYNNDSLYNNVKTTFAISRSLGKSFTAQIIAEKETSTTNKEINSAQDFQKTGFGIGIRYSANNSNKLQTNTILYRNTRSTTNKIVAYQLHAAIATTLKLAPKLNLQLKNTTKITNNDSTLENELFRSGGMNSIRGYQENSILSNSFTLFNTELQFKASPQASIYTIHDIGLFKIIDKNQLLSSIGLGYQFQKNNTVFDIAYLLNTSKQKKTLNAALIGIKITTLF